MVLRGSGQRGDLARLEVLRLADGAELLVGWESRTREPVLRSDILPREELALVEALRRHLPEGATVLAMPELSRRLARLTALDLPLASAAGVAGLRLPAPWLDAAEDVRRIEARWQGAAAQEAGPLWQAFAAALTAAPAEGAAALAGLAGGEGTHLVLHLRDGFDLGLAAGDRLAMAVRDLPAVGAHDGSRQVRAWMHEHGHAAFALQARAGGGVRAYFLMDPEDRGLLITSLLPFSSARIGQVPGAVVVFQSGGYWVYRLGDAAGR